MKEKVGKVSNSYNLFSTMPFKNTKRYFIFLVYPSDNRKICELVSNYINSEINDVLRYTPITLHPVRFENGAPSSCDGDIIDASIKKVKESDLIFAFFYKEDGDGITRQEVEKALSLRSSKNENIIYDVCIFFKKLSCLDKLFGIIKSDQKNINNFKKKLKQNEGKKGVVYKEYSKDIEVIKVVSAIILKSIIKITDQKITDQINEEELISGNGGLG